MVREYFHTWCCAFLIASVLHPADFIAFIPLASVPRQLVLVHKILTQSLYIWNTYFPFYSVFGSIHTTDKSSTDPVRYFIIIFKMCVCVDSHAWSYVVRERYIKCIFDFILKINPTTHYIYQDFCTNISNTRIQFNADW